MCESSRARVLRYLKIRGQKVRSGTGTDAAAIWFEDYAETICGSASTIWPEEQSISRSISRRTSLATMIIEDHGGPEFLPSEKATCWRVRDIGHFRVRIALRRNLAPIPR